MKIYKYALLILGYSLFAQSVFAQYDTYGRSQATREWQAYSSHHANVTSSNKSTSTSSSSNNSGNYQPFDFSRYKKRTLTPEEIAANEKYRQEQREKEKREEQIKKEKDAEWEREVNKFNTARATGRNRSYSFDTRLKALNFLLHLTDSLNKTMKWGLSRPPQSPFIDIYYSFGDLFLGYKKIDSAFYYFDKAQRNYLNPKDKLFTLPPITYIPCYLAVITMIMLQNKVQNCIKRITLQ